MSQNWISTWLLCFLLSLSKGGLLSSRHTIQKLVSTLPRLVCVLQKKLSGCKDGQ